MFLRTQYFFTCVATTAAIVGNERASSATVSETTPLQIVVVPPLTKHLAGDGTALKNCITLNMFSLRTVLIKGRPSDYV